MLELLAIILIQFFAFILVNNFEVLHS